MPKSKMKLDLNHLLSFIDDILSADSIETVHDNAFAVAVGLELLTSYMKEIAQYAIETDNPFLIEWCKNLMIVKEAEDSKENQEKSE